MSGRQGQVKRAPMDPAKGRPRMWQAMRMLRTFTVADLEQTAEVRANTAAQYVRFLARAGYLRCVAPRQRGFTGGHAHYRLVRDSGPAAPRIGKAGVRDPNTQPTAAESGVTIPRTEYERALRCIKVCEAIRAFGFESSMVTRAIAALEVAR